MHHTQQVQEKVYREKVENESKIMMLLRRQSELFLVSINIDPWKPLKWLKEENASKLREGIISKCGLQFSLF